VTVNYDLRAGWNAISFPLVHLSSASGFKYMLLYYSAGNYYPVDPVHEPGSINTRLAYLAYSEKPSRAVVLGHPNTREIRSIALSPGWNFIGCPYPQKLYFNRMTFSCEQATRILTTAAGYTTSPSGSFWLSSSAFAIGQNVTRLNLLSPEASLEPLQGVCLFAWHPILVNLNLLTPPSPPVITSLAPHSVRAGDTISINGNGFTSYRGWIALNGEPVPLENILSWSDRLIKLRVPSSGRSGDLIVLVESFPSNPVPLIVTQDPVSSGGGTLTGQVQDSSGNPLQGAQILLDNGQSAISLSDGSYAISGIAPGPHLLSTTLLGYREATGQVTVAPGASKSVLISLSPFYAAAGSPAPGGSKSIPPPSRSSGEARPERGTMHVIGDSYNDGYHRWWVRRIEVFALGDYGLRWEKSWDQDLGDTWYELLCPDAVLNKIYRIKIEWRRDGTNSPLVNTWDRTLRRDGQTETFDSPF
jgi:hypothetical protein